jgi:hypothetical protein
MDPLGDDDDWEPAPGEHPVWSMEEIESHPLFMSEVPADGNNVHVEALQSLLYDDSPEVVAANFKDQGNSALQRGLIDDAGIFYQKGIEAGSKDKEMLSQLHSNLALVRLKQERFPECVDACYRSIGFNPGNSKAFYRGALASYKLDLYSQGLYFASGGIDIDPTSVELRDVRERLDDARNRQLELRKAENASGTEGVPVNKMKFRWRD